MMTEMLQKRLKQIKHTSIKKRKSPDNIGTFLILYFKRDTKQ